VKNTKPLFVALYHYDILKFIFYLKEHSIVMPIVGESKCQIVIQLSKLERAPPHRGPLRKPWIIFAFPISESSKFFCGASWAPRASFKLIKKGGNFFIFEKKIFFLSKSQLLTPEMDSRA
jgi:hypothetical protein